MAIFRLFHDAIRGLWRQKVRSALTLLGVTVGACAMTFSLSLGFGLRAMIDDQFRKRKDFWEVNVSVRNLGDGVAESDIPPNQIAVPDGITGERRERIRQQLIVDYQNHNPRKPPKPLTEATIQQLRQIPDVKDVIVGHGEMSRLRLKERSRDVLVLTRPIRSWPIGSRIIAGSLPTSDDADDVVIDEVSLYWLGVRTDAELAAVIGQPLDIVIGSGRYGKQFNLAATLGLPGGELNASQEQIMHKIVAQLPQAIDSMDLPAIEKAGVKMMLAEQAKKNETKPTSLIEQRSNITATGRFRIVGVYRLPQPSDGDPESISAHMFRNAGSMVFLPGNSGRRFFEQLPWARENGYGSATVEVQPGGDLRAVAEAVKAQGFQQYSALQIYDNVKTEVTLIAAGLNLFALVSLFVAALGITNTLATSVVERTREIGILKAIGATQQQILLLFLLEGTVIGLLGGLIGLGIAWGISFPGDRFVANIVEAQSQGRFKPTTIFLFPLWLPVATILFAMIVTTLAALIPARRAARLQPVEALRAM